MARAMPINIYTGSISKKPIIEDLVKVVASPIKNAVASRAPIKEVNLFIIFTIFFQPIGGTQKPYVIEFVSN